MMRNIVKTVYDLTKIIALGFVVYLILLFIIFGGINLWQNFITQ